MTQTVEPYSQLDYFW